MARQRKKISHARELYYIVFILVVVLLGGLSIWGPNGYVHLKKAQQELEIRRTRVDALKRSNTEKMRSVWSLKHDPQAVEKYARKKGYVKPGELVQHLPEETPPK